PGDAGPRAAGRGGAARRLRPDFNGGTSSGRAGVAGAASGAGGADRPRADRPDEPPGPAHPRDRAAASRGLRASRGGAMRAGSRLLIMAAALLLSLLLAVRMGAVPLSAAEIFDAVRGRGTAADVAIVRELRLPRSLLAALVGAALATSGATFQALLRNPLAEPYILGVSGGAALGAVVAIVLGVGATAWGLPAAAFGGAIIAIGLVLRIAVSVGRALDTRVLLLAGVVAGAFFNACILLALTFADTESF